MIARTLARLTRTYGAGPLYDLPNDDTLLAAPLVIKCYMAWSVIAFSPTDSTRVYANTITLFDLPP